MKKVILGLFNILAGVVMLVMYVYCIRDEHPMYRLQYALTWYLPYIVASVFAFTSGILTLLGKHIFWAVIGLVLTAATLAYWGFFVYLAAITGH
jgi:hypothetical protein